MQKARNYLTTREPFPCCQGHQIMVKVTRFQFLGFRLVKVALSGTLWYRRASVEHLRLTSSELWSSLVLPSTRCPLSHYLLLNIAASFFFSSDLLVLQQLFYCLINAVLSMSFTTLKYQPVGDRAARPVLTVSCDGWLSSGCWFIECFLSLLASTFSPLLRTLSPPSPSENTVLWKECTIGWHSLVPLVLELASDVAILKA